MRRRSSAPTARPVHRVPGCGWPQVRAAGGDARRSPSGVGIWWCGSTTSRPIVLPARGLVAATLVSDWPLLWDSLLVTLTTTFEGLALALIGGIGLAILFNQSRLIEHSLYPYAVILQVTPVVAIAPLLLIYLPQQAAVLACAWIVAFFPVLANTTLGLNSVDRNLVDLFELYGASRAAMLMAPETAGGAALYARRPEDRGRAVADRRRGGGNRRRAPPAPARGSLTASPRPAIASISRACSPH